MRRSTHPQWGRWSRRADRYDLGELRRLYAPPASDDAPPTGEPERERAEDAAPEGWGPEPQDWEPVEETSFFEETSFKTGSFEETRFGRAYCRLLDGLGAAATWALILALLYAFWALAWHGAAELWAALVGGRA